MVGRTKKSADASRRKPLRSGVPVHVNEEHLAQVNGEIRELENLVDMIQEQVVKYKKDCKAELERMAEMEQEDFQRARMKIPAEQLTMLVPDIEKLWTAAKEKHIWVDDERPVTKTSEGKHDKAVAKIFAKPRSKRRSSFRPVETSTPIFRIRRTVKKTKPRVGRAGERAYSENGSPLFIASTAGCTPVRGGGLTMRDPNNAPEEC